MLELAPIVVVVTIVLGAVILAVRAAAGDDDVAAGVDPAPSSSADAGPSTGVTEVPLPEPPTSPLETSAPSTAAPRPSASTGGATSTAAPNPSAPRPSASTGGATSTAPPRTAERPVTLAFGGDVHFEGSLDGRLRADPTTILDPIAPVLSAADLAIVNLETNVTERGTAEPKEFTFRAPESAFTALVDAGVDVVSVANNHGMDFGEIGLLDTLEAADRHPVAVIGGGRDDAAASRAHRVEVARRRISVLGATQVLDSYALDRWVATADRPGLASAKDSYLPRLLEQVAAEDRWADTVVVFLHWGREIEVCPTAAQQQLAHQLVEAGADVVVGGHAHRVQGGGRLGDAVVHYGLGNFVFYTGGGPGAVSGVFEVTVDVDDTLTYRWAPARLRAGVATPATDQDAADLSAAWEELRACTDLTP